MSANAFSRGHAIVDLDDGKGWVYADTGEPHDDSRPCTSCGKYPTIEGHDACLGTMPGVAAACCGHGVKDPYVKMAPPTWGM